MEHYMCHKSFIDITSHTKLGDKVEFSHIITISYRSSSDNITTVARELIHALNNPSPSALFITVGDEQMKASRQLVFL